MAMKTFLFAVLTCLALATQGQITSTFDTDADVWAFTKVSTSVTENHQPTACKPTGFIS
jgi:hypothetical protein